MCRMMKRLVSLAAALSITTSPALADELRLSDRPLFLAEGAGLGCEPTTVSGALSVALDSGILTDGTTLYQATSQPGNWTGRIRAIEICAAEADGNDSDCGPAGGLGPVRWDSLATFGAALVPADRKIFTMEPIAGSAVAFEADALSARQLDLLESPIGDAVTRLAYLRGDWSEGDADLDTDQASLLAARDVRGTERVAYLRGDNSLEVRNSGGVFRNRLDVGEGATAVNVLGDILGSPPVHVGPPSRLYPAALESASHESFREAYRDRDPVVYFGANDGMLHGLDAATGAEIFAYIPSLVFVSLHALSDPGYAHRSYVDGPVTEGDAFVGGAWRTLIAGALGFGGQGIYLLDVTDPAAVSAANLVKWEFTDADDSDLGFTYGQPQIIKRPDTGAWAVLFGNGYNGTFADGNASAAGDAVVYVADAANKSSRTKLSTGTGMDEDPLGARRPNGIAYVTPVDLDADVDADLAYGGDLFGNVWRFDLEAGTATRVFTAKNSAGDHQPITSPVRVVRHPTGTGVLMLFGTGKYLETDGIDIGDRRRQTLYGIWDPIGASALTAASTRAEQHLLEQTLAAAEDVGGFEVRVASNRSINWAANPAEPGEGEHLGWYMDLNVPADTGKGGERVYQAPLVRGDRVVFVTITPADDSCLVGGESWVIEIETKDGSSVDRTSPFDYRSDGSFALVAVAVPADGDTSERFYGAGIRASNSRVYSTPAALIIPGLEEKKYLNTSRGDLVVFDESLGIGRVRPWREIR